MHKSLKQFKKSIALKNAPGKTIDSGVVKGSHEGGPVDKNGTGITAGSTRLDSGRSSQVPSVVLAYQDDVEDGSYRRRRNWVVSGAGDERLSTSTTQAVAAHADPPQQAVKSNNVQASAPVTATPVTPGSRSSPASKPTFDQDDVEELLRSRRRAWAVSNGNESSEASNRQPGSSKPSKADSKGFHSGAARDAALELQKFNAIVSPVATSTPALAVLQQDDREELRSRRRNWTLSSSPSTNSAQASSSPHVATAALAPRTVSAEPPEADVCGLGDEVNSRKPSITTGHATALSVLQQDDDDARLHNRRRNWSLSSTAGRAEEDRGKRRGIHEREDSVSTDSNAKPPGLSLSSERASAEKGPRRPFDTTESPHIGALIERPGPAADTTGEDLAAARTSSGALMAAATQDDDEESALRARRRNWAQLNGITAESEWQRRPEQHQLPYDANAGLLMLKSASSPQPVESVQPTLNKEAKTGHDERAHDCGDGMSVARTSAVAALLDLADDDAVPSRRRNWATSAGAAALEHTVPQADKSDSNIHGVHSALTIHGQRQISASQRQFEHVPSSLRGTRHPQDLGRRATAPAPILSGQPHEDGVLQSPPLQPPPQRPGVHVFSPDAGSSRRRKWVLSTDLSSEGRKDGNTQALSTANVDAASMDGLADTPARVITTMSPGPSSLSPVSATENPRDQITSRDRLTSISRLATVGVATGAAAAGTAAGHVTKNASPSPHLSPVVSIGSSDAASLARAQLARKHTTASEALQNEGQATRRGDWASSHRDNNAEVPFSSPQAVSGSGHAALVSAPKQASTSTDPHQPETPLSNRTPARAALEDMDGESEGGLRTNRRDWVTIGTVLDRERPVEFYCDAWADDTDEVFLVGVFTSSSEEKIRMEFDQTDRHVAVLNLKRGRYLYRFLVNDRPLLDSWMPRAVNERDEECNVMSVV